MIKSTKKIPNVSDFATKASISSLLPTSTFINSKSTELENKIKAVENKIPNTTLFVGKSVYDTKISAIDKELSENK